MNRDAIATAAASRLARVRKGLRAFSRLTREARTAARLARKSGLLFAMRPPGIRALVRIVAKGARDPSQLYRVHAANSPSKPALVCVGPAAGDQSLTFGELDDRMNRVAAALQERGLGRGARVIVMARNRPEFVEMQGGTGRAGSAGVSVSWRSTGPELAFVARDSQARAIVFEADLWPAVKQALESAPRIGIEARNLVAVGGRVPGCDRYEEDFLAPAGSKPHGSGGARGSAVVIYTSGTTGKPKGAVRKFRRDAIVPFVRFIAETPMRADDVHLVACPLYHSTAFGFLMMSSLLGATALILDEFKPEAFLAAVERYRVTTTAVVPTMLHRILALGPDVLARYDTRSLRIVFTGGAPLPGPLGTAVMDHFGDILFNFYGATETGLVTLAKPEDLRAAPGCIGKPVPGNEIRLLDDDGREVPPGRVGELYTRSRMLVDGYHDDPASTASSMRDGFFTVGDLARRDRDGRYFIEGRKRDMIISGGVNVYPAEVEAAIEAHPAVAEVAVIGADDAEWGERVRAFVVRRDVAALDEGALKAWCRERLAGPKVPRDFVFVEALPRNPTGKVLKAELRGMGLPPG
jgi:fatty-acyl-CoA synthase